MKDRENELDMISVLFLHSLGKCVCSPGPKGHLLTWEHYNSCRQWSEIILSFLDSLGSNSSFKLLGIKVMWSLWHVIYSIALGKRHKILIKLNVFLWCGRSCQLNFIVSKYHEDIWSLFFFLLSLKDEYSVWLIFKSRVMNHSPTVNPN